MYVRIQNTPVSALMHAMANAPQWQCRTAVHAPTAPLSKASRLAVGRIHSLQVDSDAKREAALVALVEPLAVL